MARIRTIKPEFWTDGRMVKLSSWARLLYIGTWNFALCDSGHLPDDPMGLKLKILPADPVDADELVDELVDSGRLVRRSTVDGRSYLSIPRFGDHQKIDTRWNSRCPFCTAEAEFPPSGTGNPPEKPSSRDPHAGDGEPHRDSPELAEPHAGDGESRPNSPLERKGRESKGSTKNSSSPASPPRDSATADADDRPVDEDSGEIPGLPPSPFLPKKPAPGSDDDPDWVKFWSLWPKKVSKSDARKAWANAVKKVAPFVVLAGAEKYRDLVAREQRRSSYIKDPSGWLNGQRWADEIPLPSAAASTGTDGHQPYRNPADQDDYDGKL